MLRCALFYIKIKSRKVGVRNFLRTLRQNATEAFKLSISDIPTRNIDRVSNTGKSALLRVLMMCYFLLYFLYSLTHSLTNSPTKSISNLQPQAMSPKRNAYSVL